MEDVSKIRVRDLFGALTTPQIWAVGAAAIGVVSAAFAIGFAAATYKAELATESERSKHETALETQKTMHSREIAELEKRIEEGSDKVSATESSLTSATIDRNNALLKATFLNHYVRYLVAEKNGGADLRRAHQLFANFVHRLWAAQEESTVDLVMGETTTTKSVRVMVEKPVDVQPFGVQRPVRYEWREQNVTERIIKIVNFSDGSSYIVPESVARDVHNRP
jgi:hypothetical protein